MEASASDAPAAVTTEEKETKSGKTPR